MALKSYRDMVVELHSCEVPNYILLPELPSEPLVERPSHCKIFSSSSEILPTPAHTDSGPLGDIFGAASMARHLGRGEIWGLGDHHLHKRCKIRAVNGSRTFDSADDACPRDPQGSSITAQETRERKRLLWPCSTRLCSSTNPNNAASPRTRTRQLSRRANRRPQA